MGVRVLPPQPEKTVRNPVPKNSLKGLNSSQIEAVSHGEGPLLVLAGSGTGKTKIIAHRIAYLVTDLSIYPWNIVAVTFTNKAAAEMKKRTAELVGDRINGAWIGTFHSICLRILNMEVDFLEGYTKDFVVYDQSDQLNLLKSCMKELDYGESLFSLKGVFSEFDAVENRGDVSFRDDFSGRRLRELYDFYKDELVKRNAMTFNDLLLLTNRLLSENEDVCTRCQNKFSHILVDEYQDTNVAQYRFVKTLSQRHRNLFVVGDDSQSIYGWRGADINNILNFERDFSGAKVVKLERNYRSTSTILGIANSVASKNLRRKEKNLWTENSGGEKAVVFRAGDNADEARFLAERISHLVESGGFSWSDVGVFYRANFQSRVIEEGLRAGKIPYKIVSGVGFYQRAEVKDIVAYLRLIQNPRDDLSFERIVNVPPRKIGKITLQKLREVSENGGFTLLDAVKYCQEQKLLPGQALRALSRFLDIVKELRSEAESQPVTHVIETLLESTGYLDYLGEDHQKVENIKELLNAANDSEEDENLSHFLNSVPLATDEDRAASGNEEVSLMTIHAAKGLEFPVVFVVGINEDLLPHYRSAGTLEGFEEERRLFYVGITRAKRLLYLSYASQKAASGGTYSARRSVFLDDLPPEHVVYESRRKEISDKGSDRSAGSSSTPQESWDEGKSLKPGQRVTHHIFGPGVIKRINGKGSEAVVTVDFFGAGVKKIVASYFTA